MEVWNNLLMSHLPQNELTNYPVSTKLAMGLQPLTLQPKEGQRVLLPLKGHLRTHCSPKDFTKAVGIVRTSGHMCYNK